MFELIALPQMVERGGCALVMALAHRIAALVDFALELLGALPGGLDGPIRISADGKAKTVEFCEKRKAPGQSHNLKVVGSNPTPATKYTPPSLGPGGVFIAGGSPPPNSTSAERCMHVGTARRLSRLERAMKWSEFLTHGFAIRGTGAVLVLPVLRDRVIKLVRAIRVALQKRLVNRPPRVIDAADCMRV